MVIVVVGSSFQIRRYLSDPAKDLCVFFKDAGDVERVVHEISVIENRQIRQINRIDD
jgi:hypothetical protein